MMHIWEKKSEEAFFINARAVSKGNEYHIVSEITDSAIFARHAA